MKFEGVRGEILDVEVVADEKGEVARAVIEKHVVDAGIVFVDAFSGLRAACKLASLENDPSEAVGVGDRIEPVVDFVGIRIEADATQEDIIAIASRKRVV